jgi:hypothetical protein
MLETAHFLNISSNNGNYNILQNSGLRTYHHEWKLAKKYMNYSFLGNPEPRPSWMDIVNNIMGKWHRTKHSGRKITGGDEMSSF